MARILYLEEKVSARPTTRGKEVRTPLASSPLTSDLSRLAPAPATLSCLLPCGILRPTHEHPSHRLDPRTQLPPTSPSPSFQVAQQDTLLALKDVMISNLGARVEALEQTSYNGQFLWRLPDIGRKMQQALSRQTPALTSPPFYTGRYGYKLCLKVYLNGDGTGAGTHISLFLVLMRGEYDCWLKWPFHHKVTFTLLDQVGERHVSSSFRPSEASSSFQRPVSNCNIASGVPEFFPLCQLQAPEATYIHEDTLAFKVLIGDTNL
uniref:MATH domain-containing protein n=1 Tax=Gopherus evgoodei TaxID=1825980 RepID=A0A8C4WSU8_9SAUR